MKKLLLTIAAAALSFLALAAEEKTKVYEFGDITRIEASFLYDVHITEGTSGNVKVVYESDYEKHLRVKYRESESKLLLELSSLYFQSPNSLPLSPCQDCTGSPES